MISGPRIRIATYNVHKCCGLDRRTQPSRIAEVIQEIDADVIAIQEVLNVQGGKPEFDQARCIVAKGEYSWRFGETRLLHGGPYGNMTLSRFPVQMSRSYDLTRQGRERRGCLRTDIRVSENILLHVFNVHLGTGFMERRHQAQKLVSPHVLLTNELTGARVVLGDFNEWTRGLVTRLMATNFESVDLRILGRYRRTYPGLLPFLHLDHFYFDKMLRLESCRLHRSRQALVASDHLPLVADFSLDEGRDKNAP
jgi:endonuclease/exonuclease/phosphatase family metal-dependent hydrolase